jgi:hypothetical protein
VLQSEQGARGAGRGGYRAPLDISAVSAEVKAQAAGLLQDSGDALATHLKVGPSAAHPPPPTPRGWAPLSQSCDRQTECEGWVHCCSAVNTEGGVQGREPRGRGHGGNPTALLQPTGTLSYLRTASTLYRGVTTVCYVWARMRAGPPPPRAAPRRKAPARARCCAAARVLRGFLRACVRRLRTPLASVTFHLPPSFLHPPRQRPEVELAAQRCGVLVSDLQPRALASFRERPTDNAEAMQIKCAWTLRAPPFPLCSTRALPVHVQAFM